MAKREAPIKHLKVRIINIVLYPEDKQRKENYINLWEKIHNDKKLLVHLEIDLLVFVHCINQKILMLFMVIFLMLFFSILKILH